MTRQARLSAASATLHPSRQPPAALSFNGEPLGFAADIRTLFRDFDREATLMFGDFDLHRYEDVRDYADTIMARIENGSMPCDGSWPREQILTFSAWIEGGKLP